MSWTIRELHIGATQRATFPIPEQHEFIGFRRNTGSVVAAYRVNIHSDFNVMITLQWCLIVDGSPVLTPSEATLLGYEQGEHFGAVGIALFHVVQP